MSKTHYGHSHHWHHRHEWSADHHHGGYDFLFGTRGDNVLEGTAHRDAIIGLKGNDALFGDGGNDWLDGGRGNDLLDGGAGHDKVFGGYGNDTAVYTLAENVGADSCGKGDFYDGGKGHDVLRLILTADEMADPAVKADIAAFEAFLADNPSGCGRNGEIFKFTSFDLAVRNFEELEIPDSGTPPQSNTPPEAVADTFSATEDVPLVIDVLANDSDADGDSLSAVVVSGPAHGQLDFNDDGSLTYTPDEDYFGSDSFTYKANDGTADSAVTNVGIEVLAVNDAPELNDENDPLVWQVQAKTGMVVHIDVLAHYNPGPGEAGDQTIAVSSVSKVGMFFGNLLGVSPTDGTILYVAPNGVPPGGHETIAFDIVDNLGEVTSAELQVDIFL